MYPYQISSQQNNQMTLNQNQFTQQNPQLVNYQQEMNNQNLNYNEQGMNNQLNNNNQQKYTMDNEKGLLLNGYPVVPFKLIPFQDPLKVLENCNEVYIKQTVEWRNYSSGTSQYCFIVFANINNSNIFLFKCKDTTGCCMRNCCFCNSRTYNIKLSSSDQRNLFLIKRPYKCYCFFCCCCKTKDILNQNIDGEQFGKIEEPYTNCNPYYVIYNKNNEPKYILKLDYCQCGFCCRRCCSTCKEVNGYIYKYNDINNIVGMINQKDQCSFDLYQSDSYLVTFPKDCSVEDKLNLISCVVFMSYYYYAKGNCNGRRNQSCIAACC